MVSNFFQLQSLLQVLLAGILGGLIGLEREQKRKEAGLRTFALVALAACLFTIMGVGLSEFGNYPQIQSDPIRIIQAIAIGVGFLGTGLIVFRKSRIEGLTTAAGLWAAAAIGVAVGLGLYLLAICATVLIIAILAVLRLVEQKWFARPKKRTRK